MTMPQFMPNSRVGAAIPTEEERRRLLLQLQQQSGPSYLPPADDDTSAPASPTATRVLEERKDAPIYSPPNITGNESALIKKPPMTLADYYADHATPIEDLERPRTATPPAAQPAGPMVTYGDQGQPRGVEGGGTDYDKDRAYLEALQHYKPENHNGRFKSGMLGFARGLMGVPGQSMLRGFVEPESDEQYANEREVARVGRSVATVDQARKQQSDLERQHSENSLRDAQTQKAMREPTYAPHYLETDKGPVVAQGDQARPIFDPEGNRVGPKPKPPGATKTKVVFNQETGKAETWRLDDGGKPVEMISGSDPSKNLVKRKDQSGNDMWVSPNTAYTGDATSDNRKYQRGRDVVQDQRHDAERSEDKTGRELERGDQRRQRAGDLTGKIDAARRRTEAATKKINELNSQIANEKNSANKAAMQEQISGWEYEKQKALVEAQGAATELKTSFGDMFEAGDGDVDTEGNAWPYYKKHPLSLSAWRAKYPKATKQQEAAWKANAEAAGMEVGP